MRVVYAETNRALRPEGPDKILSLGNLRREHQRKPPDRRRCGIHRIPERIHSRTAGLELPRIPEILTRTYAPVWNNSEHT